MAKKAAEKAPKKTTGKAASRATPAPRPYHHGSLAPALVQAALALIAETQDWAFSLREVARRAGVSHNAPYKHFAEKRDLLAAVAARGFEALAERMRASLEGVSGARARLLAVGRAYVTHGVANPALYRLMFSAALTSPDAGRPAVEKTAAAQARAVVDAVIAEGVRAGTFPQSIANPRENAAAALALWSALHGLAMLAIDDFVGPAAEVETLVEPVLGALIDGLALRPRALPVGIWIAPRV